MKRVLIVGSGAREHVIAETFRRTSKEGVEIVVFGPTRNPGLVELASAYKVGDVCDCGLVSQFASQESVHFAVIGPEASLGAGVVDALVKVGVPCVGPTREHAQLETSKGFTRTLLQEHHIDASPKWRSFSALSGVEGWIRELGDDFVIKPDGLTGGKGVRVSGDHFHGALEGYEIVRDIIQSGAVVLIEEKLVGQEFSLMSFCDGEHLVHMPAVQDHKRALVGDRGPNTGGMGTYSCSDHSLPFLEESDVLRARFVNERVAVALTKKFGYGYKGVLYGGFMAVKDGVRLIEYNARLGDPEAMNVLSVLESDFVELCEAIISGSLSHQHARFARLATVCKYAVPEGYPDEPVRDVKIDVTAALRHRAKLYFAAVDQKGDGLYLTGSRAVAVVGVHKDLASAERIAEDAVSSIEGPVFHREDIGTEELIGERVTMMEKLRA